MSRLLLSRRGFLKGTAASAGALAATLTLGRGLRTEAAVEPGASPQFRALAGVVEALMADAYVPGAALAVFGNGREEIATFGVVEAGRNEPVSFETRFQNGSITKPYTAMAAMRLAQDGKLNIDVPVRAYIPELHLADARTTDHVTIRHLLTHTGGWWGDGLIDTGDDDAALVRFVGEELPRLPQISPLGEHITYNNAAISLLGRVIEIVHGGTYRQAMQDLVFDPLRLTRTTFDPSVVFNGPYAIGHGPQDGDLAAKITPLLLPRSADPAGGIWTDIRDQIRFGRAQFGDESVTGPRVLEAAALREMQSPLFEVDGGALGWAWSLAEVEGVRIVSHDGATFGQAAFLLVAPAQRFAFALLTNSQLGLAVLEPALAAAFEQYFGIDISSGEDGGTPQTIALTPAELAEYAGRYELPNNSFVLRVEDGKLMVEHTLLHFPGAVMPSNARTLPRSELAFVRKDLALISMTAPVGFVRKADHSIGWLTLGSRLVPKI